MKVAIINRAVSGSGKSTMAREISRVLTKHQKICTIHSTDDYFLVNGEYKFDFTKLGENHAKNLEAFTNDLRQGLDCVICDNTNLRKQDVTQYAKVASDYGYMVYMLSFIPSDVKTHYERNAHGVPMDKIQIMIDLFNKDASELNNVIAHTNIQPDNYGNALCEVPNIIMDMVNEI